MSVSLSNSKAAEAVIRRHPPFLGNKKVFIKPAIFQPKRNMSRPAGNAKIVKSMPTGRYGGQEQYHSLNPQALSFNPPPNGRYVKRPVFDPSINIPKRRGK